MDWIQGEKFIKIADSTFSVGERAIDDYDGLPNTFCEKDLRDINIVYTHTIYVKSLYDRIKDIDKEFVVITHNSDVNIDASFFVPNNVVKWFTQNVNVLHDKIESIPIGLENDRWFADIRKKEKMLKKLSQPKRHKNLVYMNHNVATNPVKRERAYNVLGTKSWVTSERGVNGQDFDSYLDNIYNHKFVICPEGNGIDTHRIWEALYMGTIPIGEHNINNSFYKDLSILMVDDWEDITEDSLNLLCDIMNLRIYNTDKLKFGYWANKILKEINKTLYAK